MEIYRKIITVGLLANTNFLTLSYPRKILCAYNVDNTRVAHDVVNNEIEYPINRQNRQNGFYVTFPISLDEVLEDLGYPEVLEDVHIERIMNEDFEKVFVNTGYIKRLSDIAQETLLPVYANNDYQLLKDSFNLSKTEIKKKEKQNIKRSWF